MIDRCPLGRVLRNERREYPKGHTHGHYSRLDDEKHSLASLHFEHMATDDDVVGAFTCALNNLSPY